MTLSELITDARSLFNQTDSSNSQITDSQLTIWANMAYRKIMAKLHNIPRQENDLTAATGDMSIDSDTLTIEEAYILDPDTSEYCKLEIVDISYLQHISESWLTDDADEPRYFARKDTFTYYLYPQPDSDWVGQNIKTFGKEFPADMSSDSDTPSKLPKNLQEIIPHYMAYKAWSQLGDTEKQTNEIIFFRSALKDMKQITSSGNLQNLRFRFTEED